MSLYRYLIRPLVFLLPPERAHHVTMQLFRLALTIPLLGTLLRRSYRIRSPHLQRTLMGLTFLNPVGLAAGFDKDGRYYQSMAALGFGFVELGTVTPRPQAGNPQPRLFRLRKDQALINRMGFNNAGVDALVEQLQQTPRPEGLIIGGNIGKNKDTPNEQATEDYRYCLERLAPYVDYFVVNVSSPNTPNLRALQDKEPLRQLLQTLQEHNELQRPILLKIAPDLSHEQLNDIIEIVQETGIAGVIATNTTIQRDGLRTDTQEIGAGGLSGLPLRAQATAVIRYLRDKGPASMIIVGVGGIHSPEDAREKIAAGASLVQIYTGLVYAGPTLVKNINRALRQ